MTETSLRVWGLTLSALLFTLTACQDEPIRVGGFCSSAADCPASQVCAGGLCVGTCTTNNDCGVGEVCKDQVCLPGCEVQADCLVEGGDVTRLCEEGVCTPAERPGRVSAGVARDVDEGKRVLLSAGESAAIDPESTTFSWELVASNPKGLTVTLEPGKADGVAGQSVAFDAPAVVQDTTLLFRVTMQDAGGYNATADVEITILNSVNELPVAGLSAGVDAAKPGEKVTLSAAGSSDPNPGDTLTWSWSWTLEPPADGVTIELTDESEGGDMSEVSFIAPELPVDTVITFTLTFGDGTDESTATVQVTIWAKVEPTCDPALCDDDNACTEDGCIPLQGCTHAMLSDTSCDDGDDCTVGDTCSEGSCLGTAKECDDGEVCTNDACSGGECVTTFNKKPCDDGDGCTVDDICTLGACGGKPRNCNDGIICTDDSCADGACVATPNTQACDDGNICTKQDQCTGGACKGTLIDCEDSNPCTNDGCQQGTCVHVNNSAACEDSSLCTTGDSCTDGACKPGTLITCDDGNPCTVDSCEAATGCVAEPKNAGPCDDGDPCTASDVCVEGACVGQPLSCDDQDLCTDDSCGIDGCQHLPNTTPCDDGDPCTAGDVCADSQCTSGTTPLNCDDGDLCTADSCAAGTGCEHAWQVEAPCDDGDPCTVEDLCLDTFCAGQAIACDDGSPCTADFCQDGQCATSPLPGPCEDGDLCTIDDTCKDGVCTAGASPCDDGLDCTVDICFPDSPGECAHEPAPLGTPCLDAGGLCGYTGICHHFEVRTFLPAEIQSNEIAARLTDVMDDEYGGVSATATMTWDTGEGLQTAGFVVNLSPGAPHAVTHERFDAGLLAIAPGAAAGQGGAVTLRDGSAWYDEFSMSKQLAGMDVTSLAPAEPWYAGANPFGWTFGVRAPDTAAVFECGSSFEGGCALQWSAVGPGFVSTLFGAWQVVSGEIPQLVPAPLLAVSSLDDGSTQIAWRAVGSGWDTAAPLGCSPGDLATPCESKARWNDAAGSNMKDLWLAGDGGALAHYGGAGWIQVALGGLSGDLPAEDYALRAIERVGPDLWVAAEVPGCGSADCAADPTWKSHVLLHFNDEGGWTPERLLATRQCPSVDDLAACAEQLAAFTIEGMATKPGGTIAIVGGDIVQQEQGLWQELLAYLVQLDSVLQ